MSRRPLTNVLIGTDPECFIYNTKTNKVKSSIGIIPGTKEEPHQIKELGKGFAIQTDNILAEFNVPPTNNSELFVRNINKMKEYLRSCVKAYDSNLDILCAASKSVPKAELNSPQAKEFGCDPDYCIYTGDVNPKPESAATTTLRSAGFHVHVGYDNPEIERSIRLLLYLDVYLGIPSIIIDTDVKRRNLYGKAGCFRLTKYGCEYRTLSSFFMSEDKYLYWVYRQVCRAINAYNKCAPLPEAELVQKTINSNDVEMAKKICNDFYICDDFCGK